MNLEKWLDDIIIPEETQGKVCVLIPRMGMVSSNRAKLLYQQHRILITADECHYSDIHGAVIPHYYNTAATTFQKLYVYDVPFDSNAVEYLAGSRVRSGPEGLSCEIHFYYPPRESHGYEETPE